MYRLHRNAWLLVATAVAIAFVLAASLLPPSKPTTAPIQPNPPIDELMMCPAPSQNATSADSSVILAKSTQDNYDEQLWLGFAQNFTSLEYNVTAVAQNDTFGYGPGYLLNGLTGNNLWYQVGVSWNWGYIQGGHGTGFELLYQVWNASSAKTVFPNTSGTTEPKPFLLVSANDTVRLSLSFSQGNVTMAGYDWRTKTEVNATYFAHGASQFVSYKNHISGFPSSLLTEWYHVLPYFCDNEHAVFSNNQNPLTNAWMHIDEWNFTGIPPEQRFNSSDPRQAWVFSSPYYGYQYEDSSKLKQLAFNDAVIYSNSSVFVTM